MDDVLFLGKPSLITFWRRASLPHHAFYTRSVAHVPLTQQLVSFSFICIAVDPGPHYPD